MSRPKKQHLTRRKDGRYCCKYHGIQFMGNTEEEALRARDEYKEAERQGLQASLRPITLKEYAVRWMPVHCASVKATTYNGYISVLEHTIGDIGSKYLDEITSDDVAQAYSNLMGKSASYIHKAKILLTALLDSAADAGYIRSNPARARSIKPPKGATGTHRAITDEERRLIETTPHRMQTAAMIMLYAGLRRGEVLALDASDIGDFIRVRRAVSYVSNQPIVSTPKSEAGEREVPVLSVLRPFLRDLSGIIVRGGNGSYMTEQAWQRAWESYQRALSKAAGHPVNIRPHDLRHSYCTMCVSAGVEPHQLMQWMGHADEKLILRIYDHVTEERTQKSIEKLESSLFGMQNGMQNEA